MKQSSYLSDSWLEFQESETGYNVLRMKLAFLNDEE